MSGASHFNEVFFTDVRVPDTQRLGAVGQGWKVSLTTLMNERLAVGEVHRPDVDDLIELSRSLTLDSMPAISNGAVRERIAEWYARTQGLKFTRFRTRPRCRGVKRRGLRTRSTSWSTPANSRTSHPGWEWRAGDGRRSGHAYAMFQQALLSSPSARIAGGSDEILRNIIAERVLGLPADIRLDKDRPFSQVPTGGR